MQIRDISDPISWTISQIIRIIVQAFSYLDSIVFANTSLLEFIICLNILAVVIPLLFARLKAEKRSDERKKARAKDEAPS